MYRCIFMQNLQCLAFFKHTQKMSKKHKNVKNATKRKAQKCMVTVNVTYKTEHNLIKKCKDI